MAELDYDKTGPVATITLNRPDRKNALTIDMLGDWVRALLDAQADNAIRAIVVTGAADAFCSGIDLEVLAEHGNDPVWVKQALTRHVHQVALTLEQVDKPVIAAIPGAAVGAGMDMALLCDYRIASPAATFSEGYIRVGAVPGDGGCWLLPRVVGTSRALRLLWTGESVPAEQALALGIVDELTDDPLAAAAEFAELLANRPPLAVQVIKRAVRQGARHDLPTALDLISSHFAMIAATGDATEALDAFRTGRAPTFHGN
ncbi:enoyl-CoA hydratase/isomerase family protein [Amycolatopsis sp. GM8]|uniref:enoyl-CoA hydratase/isomerase family protein n=1 Tax=Amycolatopsis sp. GM8 TaxID=2896530 RepID=UPI001F00E7C5|nr:enoyl-CoA hydratase-related protein [Amycolatopsis sp. GM8]